MKNKRPSERRVVFRIHTVAPLRLKRQSVIILTVYCIGG